MGFSFRAMWTYRCPRCREGKIFSEPFVLIEPLKMPKRCEVCDQRTEPEPGFYFGAMFLSYIVSAMTILPLILSLIFYFNWSANGAIFFGIFILVVGYFKLLRGSRSLWLHMNVKYDPKYQKRTNEKS